MFNRLIPKIFFDRLDQGLALFVDGLQFRILYQDEDMAVVERDGAKAYLVQSPEFAAKDRPELAIETDQIDAIFQDLSTRVPQLLHPNSKTVTLRPWGAREFAVRDPTDVCVIFRQWS
jgi:hypothetical protein